MATPVEWYRSLPCFTQKYLTAAVLTAGLVSFQLLEPLKIALIWSHTWSRWELWRPVTTFLYFGSFRPDFLLSLAVL